MTVSDMPCLIEAHSRLKRSHDRGDQHATSLVVVRRPRFFAPSRTDGEYGHNGGFPGEAWTGDADWLLYPLLQYYQVTGDADFFKNKLGPALMELALFYEDFLTQTDANGKGPLPPLLLHGEQTDQHWSALLHQRHRRHHGRQARATGRHRRGPTKQGSGQGVQRWSALFAKSSPDYTINSDGALAEWSWAGLTAATTTGTSSTCTARGRCTRSTPRTSPTRSSTPARPWICAVTRTTPPTAACTGPRPAPA